MMERGKVFTEEEKIKFKMKFGKLAISSFTFLFSCEIYLF